MPLFHHDKDDAGAATEAAPEAPDRYATALAHYAALPFPARAAEVFAQVAPLIADTAASAEELVTSLMPAGSRDPQYKGATDVSYRLSGDGGAALAAGNAMEIISRRLAD